MDGRRSVCVGALGPGFHPNGPKRSKTDQVGRRVGVALSLGVWFAWSGLFGLCKFWSSRKENVGDHPADRGSRVLWFRRVPRVPTMRPTSFSLSLQRRVPLHSFLSSQFFSAIDPEPAVVYCAAFSHPRAVAGEQAHGSPYSLPLRRRGSWLVHDLLDLAPLSAARLLRMTSLPLPSRVWCARRHPVSPPDPPLPRSSPPAPASRRPPPICSCCSCHRGRMEATIVELHVQGR